MSNDIVTKYLQNALNDVEERMFDLHQERQSLRQDMVEVEEGIEKLEVERNEIKQTIAGLKRG